MDSTLEENMKKHLEGSTEREKELAVMQARLNRGDDNFAEISETLSDISSKVTRLVLLMDGCEGQTGILCKVNDHEKLLQRFFGVIGFITFMGVGTILLIFSWLGKIIMSKFGGS